ncbi:hypothetical protein SAY87_005987 [Trapa incisa]|uniref:Uncharacterized protein n=1 Tax=Trapa incisa TaxID=236973 RepID=A0AAN7K702_9MYRT|nr:hypothetical protein SAY87_005987 [Trapa incisa]
MRSPWKFIFCFFITTSIPFLILHSPASALPVLRKLLSFLVSAISSLRPLFWLLIKTSAYLLLFHIEVYRVAAQGLHYSLCQVADGLRSLVVSLLSKLLEITSLAAYAVCNFLVEHGPKIASMIPVFLEAMVSRAKVWMESLHRIVPEIMKSIRDIARELLEDPWKNYMEALNYVSRKISHQTS